MNRLAFLLCASLCLCAQTLAQPVRGVTLAHIHRDGFGYGSAECREQFKAIADLGGNWVALDDFAYMPAIDRPEVRFGGDRTLSDANLRRAVRDAHAAGLKVLLKPHLWSRDFGRGKWPGDVKMATDADWAAWFENYSKYVLNQAAIARDEKADALCIGCELMGTTGREQDWRKLIARVRAVYPGPLTYAAAFGAWPDVKWWDAVDCIGVNGYFPLTPKDNATEAELRAGWDKVYSELAPLAKRYGKPICLTELGYPPDAAAGRMPWKSNGGADDPAYQALLYKVALEEAAKRDFVVGLFVWKWFTTDEWKRFEGGDAYAVQDRPAVLDALRTEWSTPPLAASQGKEQK